MQVKDLQVGQGKVDMKLKIVELGDVREFKKFGKEGRVLNAKGEDETGQVKLTLWNEEIDRIRKGDTVEVKNGYVSEWQGEIQLSSGKYGSVEVVAAEDDTITEDEKAEAEVLEGKGDDTGAHIVTEDEVVEEEVLEESIDSEDTMDEEDMSKDELAQ